MCAENCDKKRCILSHPETISSTSVMWTDHLKKKQNQKTMNSLHAWKLGSVFPLFKHIHFSCPRKMKCKVLGKGWHTPSILKSCEGRIARVVIGSETS